MITPFSPSLVTARSISLAAAAGSWGAQAARAAKRVGLAATFSAIQSLAKVEKPTASSRVITCTPGPVSDRICMSMPEASMWARRWGPTSVMQPRMKVVRGLGLFR